MHFLHYAPTQARYEYSRLSGSLHRKSISYDKERNACTEIRTIIVANDFNTLYKADRRYGDLLSKGVEMVFRMVNHIDQDIRTYAEESLDAILRVICSVLCCLHSTFSEVVVPSIELLDRIMVDPFP
ncbi:hypothetical protein ANCDUO_00328 [Ancylostoma duodenale]|uniref:Uncharacterized protein n=1 Tax=Ancylostoma duodenale TaxID=51022 RepID=A0A0C2DH90_9BILA|nr:hypothetical protein ANCDUO_00328 [Ancylostoma duodenale]